MSSNECVCGRPTRDAAFGCDECADDLARALGDVAWLEEELEVTITRQKGIDYRGVGGGKGGKKANERPSPVVWGASEARAHLKALLVSWALFCNAEEVRHSESSNALPEDNLTALSRWLIWRVDGLMLHEIAADAIDEITSAVADCRRLIDRPAERQYLGECDTCKSGKLYARREGQWAICEECDAHFLADEIRAGLLKRLDDRLCTAAEIAKLSTYLGLQAGREQVRKRINQWHARGLIVEHPSLADEVTFRFGEVYERLAADEYEAARKAS